MREKVTDEMRKAARKSVIDNTVREVDRTYAFLQAVQEKQVDRLYMYETPRGR